MKAEDSLPAEFAGRMSRRLGSDAPTFFKALDDEAVVSVRYNPLKYTLPESVMPVPWCRTGYYLEKRPVFTFDPAIHAGCYYVQEASSMFLEQAIVQQGLSEKKILALDLCASPGGKTTHLAALLHPGSLILSNETIQTRVPALKENVIKWGSGNVLVTQNDPSAFSAMESFFDLVVVDAPCSGEGLFRKDHESRQQWSPQSGDQCSSRQKRILKDMLPCIRSGGVLVYSTCTFNEKENEEQVKWLSGETGLISQRLDVSGFEGVVENCESNIYSYSFYPHLLRGEGFFLAVFKKEGNHDDRISFRTRRNIFQPLPASLRGCAQWLNSGSGTGLFQREDYIYALPLEWMEETAFFCEALKVKYAGTQVAELKGTKAIPYHALAVSSLINRHSFPCAELNDEQAMAYLRKESVTISSDQKGWTLITWKGIILGWVNHLGNRTNNNYPVEWRVRKS